jgi:uncharacterized membrane protein YgcG/tetratricopeptide (TPR) repeat protein
VIFAFCTGDSLGSAELDADITKHTIAKAMNRGYSTVQVARMIGVDELTLLSLLEVSRNPASEEAPTSEIAVERTVQRKYRFPCPCGATMITSEKTVICTDCGKAFGIRRVGRRRHRWNIAPHREAQSVWELGDLRKLVIYAALCALILGLAARADQVTQLKSTDYVNDFAHVVDQNTIAQIHEICEQIDKKAHAQIAVVTVKSLDGSDIENYAVALFHQWGVGSKTTNRGVLILYAIDDHRARIEVGYGLEPILPDGKVGGFQLEVIPLMRAGSYSKALLLVTSRVAAVIAQDAGVQLTTLQLAPAPEDVATKQDAASQDFSKEGAVFEQITTRVVFQPDGTYTYDQHTRVRVQSDAGVRQYGILRFPYQASVGGVDVQDVRVTKPNGSVVSTPLDSIQDMTSEVSREAPMYSDLREKHVPVKGLEPGDTLECSVRWRLEKPLATGQFWIGHQFLKNAIVLDEQLEISVPREREVKLKSQTIQPTTREENGRRIYTWKTSNLESVSVEEQKKVQNYDAMRGLLPPSDVLISSFRTWEELGRWYGRLQQEKIQPSPEVKEKAEELTKGLSDDDAKLLAIYNYVSLRYRYVAISFGIGRYQPHAAAEILGNQYGDCKDKHTLLAALLSAVGIRAYPALINSRMAVDADVPSPGQFDHVISVVAKGNTLSWMDTTPEVTAIGYLVYPLRGKPALVIMPDKVAFQTTPTNSPFANKLASTVTAKLGADGTLQAHVDTMFSGDDGIYFRYTFRRVPQSQWKDLIHQMFYGGRLGGTIGDVGASPVERTEEPFNVAYDYALKDFAGGDKHRFTVPLAPLSIPEVKDEDLNRKIPLWLGYVGEYQYESRIELPKGWSATTPVPIDFKESFAEFQGSSEVHEGMLITKRRLLLKASEVTPDQLKSYKTFQKAISDDHNTYIFLRAPADIASIVPAGTPAQGPDRLAQLIRDVATLPGSSNTHALQAEQDARKSMQTKDYTSAITALKYAVSIDATFSRAWIELGLAYAYSKDKSSTLDALQKAVEADPKQVLPYKLLAFNYMLLGNRDNAIATWQKLQGIAPGDSDLAFYLGALYLEQKRYPEATSLLESAAKSNPSDAYAQVMLGTVRLRSHNTNQGLDALHKALEIDSGPLILNNVAYELAEAGTNLPEALGYSQRSVKEVEEQSQKVDLENIQKADLQLSSTIGAYWDTLGWIYFKMGDLARAESYLNSAWQLRQDGLVGDHLGQVYEKEQKLPTALHMYNLALEANPRLEETQSRMRNLAHVHLPKNRMSAAEELTLMRTIKLPSITKDTVSADFDVLIVPGGTIDKANFSRGSELLRHAGESLEKTPVEEPFPPNSTVRLLRRGTLSCSGSRCSFVFYRPSVGAGAN